MGGKTRRMVVTGREGQVVRSLLERGQLNKTFEIAALGRPELDLSDPDRIDAVLREGRPDVIVSAAAYTAVDRAETDEAAAHVINAVAAGRIAATASLLGVPIIHLSTDYVFDGEKPKPYVETDPVSPTSAYGRTKLAGERAVSEATDNHTILRTAWVYSPFGRNFLKTMLQLAESRDLINVVDDQIGNPTSALDIADGILTIAGNLLGSDAAPLRGTFHMTGLNAASWADFADEIFNASARYGGPAAKVARIPTSFYPTAARRPSNSQLDCRKLGQAHGVQFGNWKIAVDKAMKHFLKVNQTSNSYDNS